VEGHRARGKKNRGAHGRAAAQEREEKKKSLTLTHTLSPTFHPRPDGQVAYGYSLMRGRRATMEDFHHAAVRWFLFHFSHTLALGCPRN
jgi:hypothetical protein